jgi:tellurite resistance protein
MGSIFEGSPQTSKAGTTLSTNLTPQWMQDAIYNQVQWAQNIANTPYQAYELPTVAELSPLQQQAYQNVQNNQGFFKDSLANTQKSMLDLSTSGTGTDLATNQTPYLDSSRVQQGLNAANTGWTNAAAISPLTNASTNFTNAQGLSPYEAAGNILGNAETSASDITTNANPYLTAASKNAYSDVGNYMNPYQQNVMDVMAQQSARNLKENILPQVSDSFTKAGQFGSSRMGEFGSRAVRDANQTLQQQQAQLANQGYTQALGANQADLARQGQLAQTAGQLSATQAQAYQNVGQTAGQLTSAEQQNLINMAQSQGQLSAAEQQNLATIANQQAAAAGQQQQFGLGAAQNLQTANAQDLSRQQGALNDYATLLGKQQQMQTADTAALEAAGQAQQGQMQSQLNAAKTQYDTALNYPKQQMDWLSTQVRGLAPITPTTQTGSNTTVGGTYNASPLMQLATVAGTGAGAYKLATQ